MTVLLYFYFFPFISFTLLCVLLEELTELMTSKTQLPI